MKETICGHQPHHARRLCRKCYRKFEYRHSLSIFPTMEKVEKITTCGHHPHHAKGLCIKCYHKSPEIREREKTYRQSSRYKEIKKIYRQRPEYKLKRKKDWIKVKLYVLNLLGGAKCVNCGCTNIEILETNHINGGGGKEWKSGRRVYQDIYYKRRQYDDLNVKCRVCNALDYLMRKKLESAKRYTIKWLSN